MTLTTGGAVAVGVAVVAAAAAGIYSLYAKGTLHERYCEAIVIEALRAPTTYERLRFDKYPEAGGFKVYLRFVSQNGFGAAIRGLAVCEMSAEPGLWGVPDARSVSIEGSPVNLVLHETMARKNLRRF